MSLLLKDKPTNNETNQTSSIDKDSISLEEKRSNISDKTILVIPTNNNEYETKEITETIDSGNDNQKSSSRDKPTKEVALLVKSRTDDVTSSLVKSKPKSVKRNLQLSNDTTVTKRFIPHVWNHYYTQ